MTQADPPRTDPSPRAVPAPEPAPAHWPDPPPGAASGARPAPSEVHAAQEKAAASGDARDLAHFLELRRKRA